MPLITKLLTLVQKMRLTRIPLVTILKSMIIIVIMMRMTQLNMSFVSNIRFKGPFVTEDKNFL